VTPDIATGQHLADRAVELAEGLLREARAQQTSDERAQARKLARMMEDPHGKELTIALADQAFRSDRPERIADQLAYLLDRSLADSRKAAAFLRAARVVMTLRAGRGQGLPAPGAGRWW